MNDALVKIDNTLAWDGLRQPFVEVYYLILNDTNGKWALKLSYEFHLPSERFEGGMATLRAIYSSVDGEQIVLSQDFDMGVHDVIHADKFIQIENSTLSLADCYGGVQNGKQSIKWEIGFEDPVLSSRFYPYQFFYEDNMPPDMKFVLPRQFGFATGSLYINHKKVELFRSRVHQGHYYGPRLQPGWAFLSCLSFKEDSESFLHALSSTHQFGKRWIRPFHLFSLMMEGEMFTVNSLAKAFVLNRSYHDDKIWNFHFQKRGFRFEGCLWRDSSHIVKTECLGPEDEIYDVQTSQLANLDIKVFKRKRGSWYDYKRLTSQNRATFETFQKAVIPSDEKLSSDI